MSSLLALILIETNIRICKICNAFQIFILNVHCCITEYYEYIDWNEMLSDTLNPSMLVEVWYIPKNLE